MSAFAYPSGNILCLRGRADIALAGGTLVPAERAAEVGPHAVAVLVHAGDDVLRADVARFGGELVPVRGLRVVLLRAAAQKVLGGEADLRVGVALRGGACEPGGCVGLGFRNHGAVLVEQAETV